MEGMSDSAVGYDLNLFIQPSSISAEWTHKFPEELVIKIIARIPYPGILKARCLSKAWLSRLSRGSGKGQKEFQTEVTSTSENWPKYSPIFVEGSTIWGYSEVTGVWQLLKMHPSIIPERSILSSYSVITPHWRIFFGGALVCYILLIGTKDIIRVANVLTGAIHQLPQLPMYNIFELCYMYQFQAGTDGYKVIRLATVLNDLVFEIQLFLSKSNEWVKKTVRLPLAEIGDEGTVEIVACTFGPYLENSLYVLFHVVVFELDLEDDEVEMESIFIYLWKHELDTDAWHQFQTLTEEQNELFATYISTGKQVTGCSFMLTYGSRLLFVTYDTGVSQPPVEGFMTIQVFELLLESGEMVKVSTSPAIGPLPVTGSPSTGTVMVEFCMLTDEDFASDDSNIYIWRRKKVGEESSHIYCYHMAEDEWSILPPPPSVPETAPFRSIFSPGMHPFLNP